MRGDNLKDKLEPKLCNWYKGPTLMEILDSLAIDKRYPNGPLRIPILDKMKDKDLIVHGKVENGTIRIGDKLAIMPSGNPA
jgi:peptide chain release factor subunit 3